MQFHSKDNCKVRSGLLNPTWCWLKKYRAGGLLKLKWRTHSLGGHVLPQAITLLNGYYGESEAAYMCRKAPDWR